MSKPLIELRHVDVALNGRTILRGINWALRPGEHWSVAGANGSGKSTFLRLLRGELWPAPGRGDRFYRLNGMEQNTAVGVRQHIALVSPESQQRYLQQEWRLTARDVIQTGFEQSDLLYVPLDRAQRQQAEAVAQRLGIAPLLRRDVQALSTGELRKVLIARALVAHPGILLLDEVCDGLDAAFRRGMLEFIDGIARAGTQIIYTTHRADETLPAITHLALFAEGRLVAQRAVQRPDHRSKQAHPVHARPAVVQHASNPSAPAQSKSARAPHDPLIRIRHANVYLDRKPVLRDIDWELRRGENWVVLGGNGAGKTTFLKLVAGELHPAVGAQVERFGLAAPKTIWDLRRRIGCVSPLLQTHYREHLTAEQVVASGFFSSIGLMDRVTPRQQRRVRELLGQFQLEELARKPMAQLSFGELRKLLTLRALVHRPQLLIFDEPFDGLDAESRRDFARALEQVVRAGTQLLIVTHHLDDLPRCITHALFLENGRIAVRGEWASVRASRKVVELFGRG